MNWTIPTSEQIRVSRFRDGQNYVIPQEYLNNMLIHDSGATYFPIYGIDGTHVGWNARSSPDIKIWSQTLTQEIVPRFTSWTPNIAQIIHDARKILLVEGPYDELAFAPIIPWVISTNTARVQQEILDWCKMWRLHVYTAFDNDTPDPAKPRQTGQEATEKITKELAAYNCPVTKLTWPGTSPAFLNGVPQQRVVLKDPAQAYAVLGQLFHTHILNKVNEPCLVTNP